MSECIRVLNANVGANNIVRKEDINKIMDGVITELGLLLEDHFGPYGTFAMITPDELNPIAEPIFTKDGINIVNATKFINPIESHTRDMMAYIGKKIERAAGDGTTSSMLICSILLTMFRKYLLENSNVNYRDFVYAYDEFIKDITTQLDKLAVYVPEKDKDFIKTIAYHQAMTSSHGDVELSAMVSELMAAVPKEAWKHLIYKRESRETSDKFRIEVDNSSYSLDAYIFDNTMLNSNVNTEYHGNKVDLFITTSELISNGLDFDRLCLMLEVRTKEDKEAVIICGQQPDNMVNTRLSEIYRMKKKEGVNFTIFRLPIIHPVINDLEALYATTGYFRHKIVDGEYIEFKDIDIVYKQGVLYLYNLVKYENGEHPHMKNKNSPVNAFLYAVDMFLKESANVRTIHQFGKLPELAKKIANNIKCEKQGYIVIGGSGYDNQAAKDVIVDVLSAVRESLTKGITLGGYKTLALAIENSYFTTAKSEDFKIDTNSRDIDVIKKNIGSIFLKAIYHILDILYVKKCPYTESIDKTYKTSDLVKQNNISFNVITGTTFVFNKDTYESIKSKDVKEQELSIIQPKNTDIEFIKRFGEVVIKFLFTNKVLIPNSVNIEKE